MAKQAPPGGAPLSGKGMRLWICATRWNADVVEQLIGGAAAAIEGSGATLEGVHRCAGVFELGPLCARLARKGGFDGIVALGCLVRGDTDHYALLASEVTRSLGSLAIEAATSPRPIAVAFGVLTCDTMEQAARRAAVSDLNKGGEAALACIEQVRALREVGD
jgi:6,7-dimethyl-8-ribityllumazine synthase